MKTNQKIGMQRVNEDVCGGGIKIAERAGPSAQEQQRGHAAHVDHVGVLGHEEHGELHGAVFGVIAAGEFAFRFGQIEGRAVGFGVGGHQVDEERHETGSRRRCSR